MMNLRVAVAAMIRAYLLAAFALTLLGGMPQACRGAGDIMDGSNTVARICSHCHGEIPPPAACSLKKLTNFANGGPHGGGPEPYVGVNLTNLAAYVAHWYHEQSPLQTYAVYGVVTDVTGRGIGNVRVRATSNYLALPEDLATNTTPDGAFFLAGLPAGDVQFVPEASGYAFVPPVITVDYFTLILLTSAECEFLGCRPGDPPLGQVTVIPPPVHVRPDGDDQLSGKSWLTAKRTIQAALDAAAPGGKVWLVDGLYREQINVLGRELYGGFAGHERDASERDPGRHPAVLDGTPNETLPALSVVHLGDEGTNRGRLDGLVIQNGRAMWPNDLGGGVCVAAGAAPTIANCWFRQNQADYGGAIGCLAGAAPVIMQNRIEHNYAGAGGGIYAGVDSTPALIANNLLLGNTSDSGGAAVHCEAGVTGLINNTIVGNCSFAEADGALFYLLGTGVTANNLVAFNSAGLEDVTLGTVLRNNCVYGNTNGDYVNMSAGPADLIADPLLENPALGDGHVRPDSPCVDAGDAAAAAGLAADLEGRPRAARLGVDIGACELPPPALQVQAISGHLRLSWPVAENGFILETRTQLNEPWQPLFPAATTNDTQRQVLLSNPGAAAFFRLRK